MITKAEVLVVVITSKSEGVKIIKKMERDYERKQILLNIGKSIEQEIGCGEKKTHATPINQTKTVYSWELRGTEEKQLVDKRKQQKNNRKN